jgi:hypothetical protein
MFVETKGKKRRRGACDEHGKTSKGPEDTTEIPLDIC